LGERPVLLLDQQGLPLSEGKQAPLKALLLREWKLLSDLTAPSSLDAEEFLPLQPSLKAPPQLKGEAQLPTMERLWIAAGEKTAGTTVTAQLVPSLIRGLQEPYDPRQERRPSSAIGPQGKALFKRLRLTWSKQDRL